MTFEKILAVAKKYSYFSRSPPKTSDDVFQLKLGNSGLLFRNNIKNHWSSSNISKSTRVFDRTKNTHDKNEFCASFETASNFHKKLPFDFVEFYKSDSTERSHSNYGPSLKFSFPSCTILSFSKFLIPDDSTQYFFNLQRQRKLWWKKISACPERFSIGETTTNSEDGVSTMEIVAQFPWGKHIVERITLSDMKIKSNALKGDKNVYPVRISNEISAEDAVVTLYCDGAELESEDRKAIRLNKTISPYKCIFAVDSESSVRKDLFSFSWFLNRKLEDNNILSILPYDSISLKNQFQRNDEWGLPFSIKIDENSLNTGIVGLRCIDTTLIEEIHILELTSHILSILNADNAHDIPLNADREYSESST